MLKTETKVKNIYDLTPMQEGMLFHSLYQDDSEAYIEVTDILVKGNLNIELLEETFSELVARHDILRTVFLYKKTQKPRQVVLKDRKVSLHFEDLSEEYNANSLADNFLLREKRNQFDLSKDTLIRLNVLRLDKDRFRIIWSFHHIIMDGWCMGILMDEFFKIYASKVKNEKIELPDPIPFSVYLKWLSSQDKEEARDFWQKYLENVDTVSKLPGSQKFGVASYRKQELDFNLDQILTNKINKACNTYNVSINVFIQTIWTLLLQKLNGTEDVVFGTVVSGRPPEINGVEGILGLFINTIPVYNHVDKNQPFKQLIQEVHKSFNSTKKYDYFPLPDILNQTNFKQDLFDHILVFENFPVEEASQNMEELTGLSVENMHSYEQTSYDFNAYFFPGEELHVKFDYNGAKYSNSDIELLKERFISIISTVLENESVEPQNLEVVLDSEKEWLLSDLTGEAGQFTSQGTLVNYFTNQVTKSPGSIALAVDEETITYDQLNNQSNNLAAYLLENGVDKEDIVGIRQQRTANYIVSMLAIMKTGAAYVPIDPNYPIERQDYIIADSKAKLVLTDTEEPGERFINVAALNLTEKTADIDHSTPEELGYIIYTSGSTGNPKGVAIEHRNAVAMIDWATEEFKNDGHEVVFAGTSFSFDLSIFEIFFHLSIGKQIRLLESGIEINKWLSKEENILLNTVPSVINDLQNLEADFSNVVSINMAGEPIPVKVKERLNLDKIRVRNLYGPSEDTTYSTIYEIKEVDSRQLIGKPITGTKAYVLDADHKLVPKGVAGELYLSGTGITRGYLYKEELTNERFISDPFDKKQRLYKTGDSVKWNEEWNLEYLGRIDNQVKIRGHRIELGEIETTLVKEQGIKEAVVIAQDVNDDKQLVAYLVSTNDLDEEGLKKELSVKLPAYMVPAHFVVLEELPLTPNGKIDKRALPKPKLGGVDESKTAPQTETEKKLAKVWQDILGVERVYQEDNFFSLGGHSLKATVLISLIQKEFSVDFPISKVFDQAVLSDQAAFIDDANTTPYASIKPVSGMEDYPLSAAQKRMYLLNEIEQNSTAYNLSGAVKVTGEFDSKKVQEAVQRLLIRHESLRTIFQLIKKEVVQIVLDDIEPPVELKEISEDQINDTVNEFVRPFNLSEGPLFRIGVFKVFGSDQTILAFDMHHIISDGVSIEVLISEFLEFYHGARLEPLEIQYKDFAVWQAQFSESLKYKDQENYWISQFSEEIPVLELNYDFKRPVVQDFSGNDFYLELGSSLSTQIKEFCTQNKVTPFAFFTAMVNILLHKYSGQKDLVIGTPVAGRQHADLQKIIGMFVNTLALKNEVDPYLSIDQFVKKVGEKSLKAIENQDYPFDILVEKLNIPRSLNRNPLFDVMIAFQNMDKADTSNTELEFESLESGEKTAKFDLTFFINESEESFGINLQYATSLFEENTIKDYLEHLKRIAETAIQQPQSRIGNLNLLSAKELQAFNSKVNHTEKEFDSHNSILELIGTEAKEALLFDGNVVSYDELNKSSNQLAHYIGNKGIKKGDRVSILMDRSEKMIVSILGVLKSGAAYVPIDPKLPQDRINYILDDSQSKLLITDKDQGEAETAILDISSKWNEVLKSDDSKPEITVTNEDSAYIIYTSGSTGKPKGCELTHGNLLHYIQWANSFYFDNCKGDFPLYTSISFDLTITSIFSTLSRGRRLKVYPQEMEVNDILKDIFESGDIDILKITPAHITLLKALNLKTDQVKVAIVGGDQLTMDNIQTLRTVYPNIQIFNEYGPTEATVGCVVKEIEQNPKSVTIGRPISNMQAHVLDEFLNPVPKGVRGELYLSGKGLAKGYFNKKELTNERFITSKDGTRLYKTGDIAYWDKNDELVFVGRNDFQLKIRGYRIELGEIENCLLNLDGILETAVIADTSGQEPIIVAYYAGNRKLENEQLIELLSTDLPDYMIPQVFMSLDKIPLTSNGKVDRKALPKPELLGSESYVEPGNEMERRLAALWKEALGISKIGIKDNFFRLGGHSLKATILCAEIERSFGKKVDLKSFFANPTIEQQVTFLEGQKEQVYSSIKPLAKQENYEVSPAQKRLWVLDQIHGGTIEYNMPAMYHFEQEVDQNLLEQSFKALIDKHEILRTNFISIEGEPKQEVLDHIDFDLGHADLSQNKNFEKELRFIYNSESEYEFDLSKDQLLRATLVKENDQSFHLVFVMHHIISDGWSIDILQRELLSNYKQLEEGNLKTEPLEIQYKDYSAWQNDLVHSEEFSEHKRFWHTLLKGDLPVTEIPKDYRTPSKPLNTGSRYTFYLDTAAFEKLKELTGKHNISFFMFLLAVFKVLIFKTSQSDDIIVGTPVAGRQRAELKDLIGFFLNTVVLRNSVEEFASFSNFMNKVKNNTLEALEHQDYPFEQLVDDLNIPRDINTFPITSIFFNMLNTGEKGGKIEELTSSFEDHNHKLKFDIDFYASEYENTLKFDIDYKNELYSKESIEVIAEKFNQIIQQVIEQEEIQIDQIQTRTSLVKEPEERSYASWYSKEKTIIGQFHEIAKEFSNLTAVRYKDKLLSYSELNQLSNGVANTIMDKDKTGSKAGIFVQHNHHLAISVLGVLKSGKTYVSLDPDYPRERNEFVAKENELKIILTDKVTLAEAEKQFPDAMFMVIDEIEPLEVFKTPEIKGSDEAYVLYTSGSTGKPKGAVQTHAGVMHFIGSYSKELNITEEDVLTGFSSASFDSFNNDFFGAILNGATYCPVSLKKDISIDKLHSWLIENKVTFFHSVPTVFRAFANQLMEEGKHLNDLRIIKMTGEPTRLEDFTWYKRITTPKTTFVVSYGCTESTLNTIKSYTHDSKVRKNMLNPGEAVINTDIKILDKKGRVLDCLEVGEIAVASDFVTTGYFNNPELNEKAFTQIDENRYYKTGDEGRILANGELEISGRTDNQVKIRGVRVELAEIEHVINEYPGIEQTVVTVDKDETGLEQVSSYFTHSEPIDKAALRKSLNQKLPDYFIPTYYIELDAFPLTPNGKIDKRNLPKPHQDAIAVSTEYKAPSTDIEKQIVALWEEVLERDKIGVLDNFFELGGHSLKATAFVARYYKNYEVNIPLQEVFKNPTVESLALFIEKRDKNIYSEITKREKQEYYPLTSSQKRLFVLNQFDQGGTNYNMPAANHIYGKLNVEKLEKAFQTLVDRHDSLRTQFVTHNEEIVQQVLDQYDFKIEHQERNLDEINKVISEFIRPFDLAKAPLFRIGLTKFSDDHHLLLFDMHHIISDGRSLQVITDEFIRLYGEEELEPLKIQYTDYALWQEEFYNKPEIKEQEKYWLSELKDEIPVLELPYDYPRPEFISNNGTRYSFSLSQEESAKVKFLGRKQGATTFMTLLAIYNVLLHKFSTNTDIVVGSPIAGRPDVDLENIIGMFVNTLAMRTQPDENKSFSEYLSEVKEAAIRAYDNQFFSFETIVEKLDLRRDTSRNPVFDTMFVLQDPPELKSEMADELNFVYHQQENKTTKFDISWIGYQNANNLDFDIEYCTDLFKESTIESFAEAFKSILSQVIENPGMKLEDIEVLSDKQKKVLSTDRFTEFDHNITKTTSQIIDEVMEENPNEIAVAYKGQHISYGEVSEKMNGFAFLLQHSKGKRVGIILDKSDDMIYAILGVLKSGNSYVPLDTSAPVKRLNNIIENAEIETVICSKSFQEKLKASVIYVEDVKPTEEKIANKSSLDSEAYVIYTSGSTGKPKGVSISHISLIDKLFTKSKVYEWDKELVSILTSSYTFDASILEIFPPLIHGKKLAIPEADKMYDFEYLLNLIKKEGVTIIQGTTSYFKTFLQSTKEVDKSGNQLKDFCIGGESLTKDVVNELRMEFPAVRINNHYGPTEGTVDAIIKRNIKAFDKNIIGKPLPNVPIYILSDKLKMVPEGVKGEICIGGITLANGYVNAPELTANVFVDNPFVEGEKLYRTGDLGRWTKHGEIEFLGRKDTQVKVRGYRVELGEIRSVMLENDFISNAVVNTIQNKNGDMELVAYIVTTKEVNIKELRNNLLKFLPSYMIPSYFVELDEIPLTRSGKTDFNALPQPSASEMDFGSDLQLAESELEKEISKIWEEILEKKNIGVDDNFFELGGHSLKATQVVSRIQKDLNHQLNLRDFFRYATIRKLADFLSKNQQAFESIPKVEEQEHYALSNSQKRLWVIDQIGTNKSIYNMPGSFLLEGKLDYDILKKSFDILIERQESLRTVFVNVDGDPRQKILPSIDFKIDMEDVSGNSDPESEAKKLAFDHALIPFDLETGPLVRALLIKLDDQKHVFVLTMHHIISDGWSLEVMINELTIAYKSMTQDKPVELKPLNIQYKDFAHYQNERIAKEDEEYWLQRLSGDIGLVRLPYDFPHNQGGDAKGEQENIYIEGEIVNKLKELAKEHQTTLSNVVLSVFNILLSQLSGQSDILIGMTSANRNHPDIEDLVGFFVNSLVIRTDLSGDLDIGDLIEQVKKNTSEAFEHQNYPFDMLVEKLSPERFANQQPLVNVTYSFQNLNDLKFSNKDEDQDWEKTNDLKVSLFNFGEGTNTSKFDLLLFVNEVDDGLDFKFEYNSNLFRRETIGKYLAFFKKFLNMVTQTEKA